MAYSIHQPLHEPFSISTTSLSPSLYIRDFFGLICLLTSSWRAYVYMKLFWSYVRVRTYGDLFCTLTSSYWSILYICNFLIAYFLHTPFDPFNVSITCSWPSLYTNDVNSLYTSPWWAYHYLIDIISLRTLTSGDIFCTNTLSSGSILYVRNYLMAYSVHRPLIFYNYNLFLT